MIQLAEDLAAHPSYTLPALIKNIFQKGGWLQQTMGLEHRPQQEEMACAIIQQMIDSDTLLCEAGTGVGKSLAYLIPGIIFAIETKRPFLVSTHTIALQEQIRGKDMALCRSLFAQTPQLHKYASFKDAMLVGKSNYLCRSRLVQAIQTKSELFPTQEQEDLERIADWSQSTQTGLLEELSPPPSREVWSWVNADSSVCSSKRCGADDFYPQAKEKMRQAHVIILNHSLLFSLINAGMSPGDDSPGVLFPNDFLVMDEAHTIPDLATNHFGHSISSYGIDRILKMLFNPKRNKGLVKRIHGQQPLEKLVAEAIECCSNFFNTVKQQHLQQHKVKRMLTPLWGDTALLQPLRTLMQELKIAAEDCQLDHLKNEIKDQHSRLLKSYAALVECLEIREKETVYWLERSGKTGQLIKIMSAPLQIASTLQRALFTQNAPITLTSATLTVNKSLHSFQSRIGAQAAISQVATSPFPFEELIHIFVATDCPEPQPQKLEPYHHYLSENIRFCSEQISGGTLALFTSYQDMQQVANHLRLSPDSCPRPLLVQGEDASRSELLAQFKQLGNALLLGTDSFWTGVDVPGPALSQVIITRLPFQNPSHPIIQARSEWHQAAGRSPFAEMTLPDAIIKFRQGIGRLVRTYQDSGYITILDSRILNRQYGRTFLQTLPKKTHKRFDSKGKTQTFTLV